MKTLVILLILVLLPFSVSVDAGVKFETYDASDLSWDFDTTCLTWDDLTIIDDVSDYCLSTGSIASGSIVSPRPLEHDTLQEYITGLDTVIIMHRIECDTNFTKFFVENDSTFVQIEGIACDTIFRVEFRDVWAPKVQGWFDSLQWRRLLELLRD